jgi:hypothetical protein
MSDSTMDEMVFLCHSTKKPASNIPKSIRVVSFSTEEGILGLLGVSQATKSQPLRAGAAVFVPSHHQLPIPEGGDGSTTKEELVVPSLEHGAKENEHEEDGQEEDEPKEDEYAEDGQEEDEQEDGKEEILEAENDHEVDIATTTDLPSSSDVAPQPSEEQIQAASVIQRMYRQHLQQQRRRTSKLNQSRNHHFNACLARSKQLSFPSLRYRLLFLGTLPHLLVCIEAVHTYAHEAKTKQKRLFLTGKNDILVESGKKLTQAVYVTIPSISTSPF